MTTGCSWTFLSKLPANAVVLMDEAYHHFALGTPGYESFLDRPINDDRLLVDLPQQAPR